VGVNASARIPTKKDISSLLGLASKKSDLQVVYIHWGTEYELTHSKAQELLAKELVSAGADLIVGHHPHVVQDVDVIDGVVVFYSLGNYIFDQYFNSDVMKGLVLVLEMNTEPIIGLVPVESIEPLSQPRVMTPDDQRSFLLELANRSDEHVRPMIERGFVPLTDLVATSTKMAIMMR
jgi:poly-gamma-glutamate synthesis protein (capsule biosynthesis protein)